MRRYLILVTLFLTNHKTFAYNPWWTHTDKKLITTIVRLDKNNPKQIEQYFKGLKGQKSDPTKEKLGFGWTMWATGIGGGYISISAKFFYYQDSLVSYSLTPELPKENELQKRYKKWYDDYFSYSNSTILPYKFNEGEILKPLKEYTGKFINVDLSIKYYMSPNSGTMYSVDGVAIIQNRREFVRIKDSLTNDLVFYLMYSINPASRLTAINYYLNHKPLFSENRTIDKWVEENFAETPNIKTRMGCEEVMYNTQSLFSTFYFDKYYR